MFTYIKQHWKGLLISIFIAEAVGAISGFLTGDTRSFYTSLVLPPLAPPGWLFGVVWPILYACMGIASYIIYDQESGEEKDRALSLYNTQLLFNFTWSIVFFNLHSLWGSVIIIIVLDILVLLTIKIFNKTLKVAAYLLYPYMVWIIFATYLNIGIAILN
ncbi:MAG: TspO/MBR family protein [Coprobacillaceae bacterium]